MKHYFAIYFALFIFMNMPKAQNGIRVSKYISGVTAPVGMAHCNDGRLFVIEQGGKIRIIENGKLVDSSFLDITTKVRFSGEQGLLGLAFHPRYDSTGFIYVNYVSRSSPAQTVIERYKVSSTNRNKIDPNSGQIILTIAQPYANHNGGCIKFGKDGFLYIGMGDGGSGGDPQNYAQNKKSLLGKMLRIDVDTSMRYKIPASNPFVNDTAYLPEIWAIGLRNPWRFSFDRLTQDLWIGDVGQGTWEEVDFDRYGSPFGKNYGWKCWEGNKENSTTGCLPKNSYTFPIHQYGRDPGVNCASITGGYVYRGSEYPSLYGKYFYADYCVGKIWLINRTSDTSYTNQLVYNFTDNALASFGEDASGALYFTDVTTSSIFKISDTCNLKVNVITTDPICFGESNGQAKSDIPDPVNAKFMWSTGDTLAELKNLKAGSYQLSVLYNGCLANSSFTIINPPANITHIDLLSCDVNGIGSDTIVFATRSCDSIIVVTTSLKVPDTACITTPFITEFCKGDSALLIACDPVGAVSFKWYRDRVLIDKSNVKRFWVYDPGIYQFTYVDSLGCESYFSQEVKITVHPIPEKPALTLSQDTLIATPGYTSYRWFLDGNLLGGSILNTWIASKEGIYQVEIIDSNQCHSVLSDTLRYIVTKNREIFGTLRNIDLIPNPVNSQLIIKLNAIYNSEFNWKILNAQSEVVVGGNHQANQNLFVVDVHNLLAGFYIFIIEEEKGRSIKYFLKI